MPFRPDTFRILSEQISKGPLAQLVRATDVDLFDVLRRTIFAMVTKRIWRALALGLSACIVL